MPDIIELNTRYSSSLGEPKVSPVKLIKGRDLMDKYILKKEYALRCYLYDKFLLIKWEEPFLYAVGYNKIVYLRKDEFDFLLTCDGEQEIKPVQLAFYSRLTEFIEASTGDTGLSEWQKNIFHDNQYYKMLEWCITEQCNYSCPHCFSAKDEKNSKEYVKYEDALKIIDELSKCGVPSVDITGGEPLIHNDFIAIVKALNDKGIQMAKLTTNGRFITGELLDEIEAVNGKALIAVSFDGFGYHDWMRNCPGAEENTLKAIRLIKEKKFPLLINAQINGKTKDAYKKTIDYFGEMGIDTLRFIRTSESSRWTKLGGGAVLSTDEYNDLMVEVVRYFDQKPRRIRQMVLWEFGVFTQGKKRFNMVHTRCLGGKYVDRVPVCTKLKYIFCMSAAGNVYPCLPMSGTCDSLGIHFGNIHEQDLQSILKDGKLVKISKMTAMDVKNNNKECPECRYFKQCLSGCPAIGFLTTGSFYGKDAQMCALYKGDYERKIEEVIPDWENANPIYDT